METDENKKENKPEDKGSSSSSKSKKDDLGIEVSSATDKKPEEEGSKRKKRGKLIGVIIAVILIVVIAGLVILGLGIYQKRWDKQWEGNPTMTKIIDVFPFPLAWVNGEMVSLSDYWKHLKAMKHFYTNMMKVDFASDEGKEALAEIEAQLKDKLVLDVLVEQQLEERDIKITDEDIEAEFQNIVSQAGGSEEEAIKALDQQFGWNNKDDIKKYVVRPILALRKLKESVEQDESYKDVAKSKAEDVLNQVKEDPEKFADLAKENSDDPQSGMNGGELGFFARGMMVPEFEEAAFALEPGAISDLVETEYGFHIILVKEKGQQPKMALPGEEAKEDETEEQVNASHILFSYFDTWLKEKQKEADISTWL
ncbi:peptidylprolyl isomerase [Patescibacteria group bacterium]